MPRTAIGIHVVVLGLPRDVPGIIVRMNYIVQCMTANASLFTAPPLPLTDVTAHIERLTETEAAVTTGTRGTRDTRDQARGVVTRDGARLHGYVTILVHKNPESGASIAAAAGMWLRQNVKGKRSDLAVKQDVSRTVLFVARTVPGARAYEWQYSKDGGVTWISVPPTTGARTTVPDLEPATIIHVRFRALTKSGVTDWSSVVVHVVS